MGFGYFVPLRLLLWLKARKPAVTMGFGHLWRSSLNKLVQKPIVSTGFASITNSRHSVGKMSIQVNFFTFKRVTDSESASKVTLGACSGSWDSLPTNFDGDGRVGRDGSVGGQDQKCWFKSISSLWSELQIRNQRQKLCRVHAVIPFTGCGPTLMELDG